MTLSSTSTRTAASAICWLALTGAAVLFSTELYANRHGLIDDAYITFRYARNLAQGEGLVFNPGGQPTEGFTSVLWVLVTAPAFWLGADPLEYARVVSGILAVLGAGVLTFVYKSLTDPVTFRLSWPLPTLLWLGHDTSAFHLMLGMETTAYTVLLMCAVAFYAGFWTRSGREARGTVCAGLGAGVEPEARWWLRGFFGTSFLCGLMRPEGFAVAALLTAVLLVYGGLRRRHLVELAPFLVALAVYLVAKSVTLGNVLPNSFHLKIGQVDALVPGADFVIRFLDTFGTWLTLGALGILLIKPTEGARRIWIGLIVVLCFFLVFYVRTLPLMAWQHRYLIPYVFIPALGSAAVIGFGLRHALSKRRGGILRTASSYGVAGVIVAFLLGPGTARSVSVAARGILGMTEPAVDSTFDLHYAEVELGKRLGSLGLGGRLSLAFWDSGAIPYFSDCHFIDLNGLNDNVIARMTDGDALVRYVLEHRPNAILFATRDADGSVAGIRRALVRPYGLTGRHIESLFDRALAQGYRHVGTYETPYYDIEFFVDPSSDGGSILANRFSAVIRDGA